MLAIRNHRHAAMLPRPNKPIPKAAQLAAESEAIVGSRLENIIRTAIQAVNTRDFSLQSSAWADFSPEFHNDPDGPTFQQFVATQNHKVRKPTNLKEFLAVHQDVAARNPAYRLNAVELHTTNVNEKAGYAQVIMTGEAIGIPEGVVRRSISAFEFRLIGGRWWCVKTKTLPGMDPSARPSGL